MAHVGIRTHHISPKHGEMHGHVGFQTHIHHQPGWRTCVCWGCKSHSTITSMVGHIPSICLSAPQEHQRCHLVWSKSLWRSQAAFNESKKIHSCSYQFTTEASLCWRYNVSCRDPVMTRKLMQCCKMFLQLCSIGCHKLTEKTGEVQWVIRCHCTQF